jgi:hypothetical protein
MHSRVILPNAKRDHLDRVHSDQMILETLRPGRLVLFYWRPRVSKLTQKRLSGLTPLRSDGSCNSQTEAGPCERRLTQGYIL